MNKDYIEIGGRKIGPAYPPFVVAEMSGNHNQSLERALAIVDAAAKAGAHGLKIQTYTAETMTLDIADGDFLVSDENSLWNGSSLYDLYDEAHTPWEWHEEIFSHARKRGLMPFSTPFDDTSVDFLEALDVPCYKIASFENTDLELLKKVASTGRPIIISTGMASVSEIDDAVQTVRDAGAKELVLLKCTSTYPASPENTNILTIPHLKQLFNCMVGISDHTMGIGVSVASVALGASFIEKHFTLDRDEGGVDSAFSLEPAELATLVVESERAWHSLGQIQYGASRKEEGSKIFRRSLYVVHDIKAGEKLTIDNVRAIRPGYGMAIKHLSTALGLTVTRDVKCGTALTWDLLKS